MIFSGYDKRIINSVMDQGSLGPIELLILHTPSGELARPSWDKRLIFQQSWHANYFLMQKLPLPPNCEWIKVFTPFANPKRTFTDLLCRANAGIPHLDPAGGKKQEKELRNILLEL